VHRDGQGTAAAYRDGQGAAVARGPGRDGASAGSSNRRAATVKSEGHGTAGSSGEERAAVAAPAARGGGGPRAPHSLEGEAEGAACGPAGGAVADAAPPRPARRRTRSLVLWSGGLDSTYTLVRLLRETRDVVYSHFVRLPGERFELEEQAIARLRTALAGRVREYAHTASRLDPGCAPGADAALLAFLAARVAAGLGFTPFDRLLLGVNGDRDPGWDPRTAACALRRARIARAVRAAWGCDEVPQLYLWEPRPLRAQMRRYLGPALAALTVSCTRPMRAEGEGAPLRSCGRCERCREPGPQPDGEAPAAPALNPAAAPPLNPAVTPPLDAAAAQAPGLAPAPAARTTPLFRHLVEARSRTPAPPGAAAASDPRAP